MTIEINSAIYCEHANECPSICPCLNDCYCKSHTCKEGKYDDYSEERDYMKEDGTDGSGILSERNFKKCLEWIENSHEVLRARAGIYKSLLEKNDKAFFEGMETGLQHALLDCHDVMAESGSSAVEELIKRIEKRLNELKVQNNGI